MNRQQLEHILGAAGAITDEEEIVILGSQAILGMSPESRVLSARTPVLVHLLVHAGLSMIRHTVSEDVQAAWVKRDAETTQLPGFRRQVRNHEHAAPAAARSLTAARDAPRLNLAGGV